MIAFTLEAAARVYAQRTALAPTTLRLARGERIALLGPSGSGKSTLIALLAGSLRASAGTVHADARDLTTANGQTLRRHRRRCAIVPQGGALVPQLTVHGNALATRLARSSSWRTLATRLLPSRLPANARDRADVAARLADVDLAQRQDSLTNELSGGERQRVAIARALLDPADALLCDEPSAGLDPALAERVIALLAAHAAAHKATFIVATHWASITLPHVDRVIGLTDGQVVIDSPRSNITEADLAELYANTGELR